LHLFYVKLTNCWLMITIKQKNQETEPIRILLIGNNPIEMSKLLEVIANVPDRKIVTETAFDVKSVLARLIKFEPTFILIDDNIGRQEFSNTVESLSHTAKTRDVPITVIKNSNYNEALATADILDFLLKKNLTTDSLYNTIKNTLKFRRTRQYLAVAYNRSRGLLMRLAGT
jgi:chemotaxis response regulator CheB